MLFDLDGTLHDRNATIRHWLAGHVARFGLPSGYAARFVELDDFGYRSKREVFPALIQEFRLSCGVEELLADYERALDYAQAMPHAHDVLYALRMQGLRVGVVTNGWAEAQTRCVQQCRLAELVDDVVISQAIGYSKPQREIYALALERLGVSAAQAWFVGDSPRNDVWGPQQVGLRAAYLPTGHALGHEQPDACLENLRDVLRLPLTE